MFHDRTIQCLCLKHNCTIDIKTAILRVLVCVPTLKDIRKGFVLDFRKRLMSAPGFYSRTREMQKALLLREMRDLQDLEKRDTFFQIAKRCANLRPDFEPERIEVSLKSNGRYDLHKFLTAQLEQNSRIFV